MSTPTDPELLNNFIKRLAAKMDDTDNVILYLDGSKKENSHESALRATLVTPRVGFTALHDIDRELVLTRLPCSKETAEKWVAQMRESLKERFIYAEMKEVEI